MKRTEALEKIRENTIKRFGDKYNIKFDSKSKITLRDPNNENIILYTVILKKGYMPNYVMVYLYNGKLTERSLTFNMINIKDDEPELEIIK